MIAFFIIVCVLVGFLVLLLYFFEVVYFGFLTGHNNISKSKLYITFLVIVFLVSIGIGLICGKYGFLAGKNSLLMIFCINFLVFFAISYYYCFFMNYIFGILRIKNQTLIAILGFIPTFFFSNVFLGTMIGTFLLK